VLLVHGYGATESVWTPLRHALAGAGFGHIVSVSYNSVLADPAAVTAELTEQGLRAAAAVGAERVHLVGHSLGGLIVRCALAAGASLSSRTASAVTIASPYRGAWLARLAPGRFAPLMHRGGCPGRPQIDVPILARWRSPTGPRPSCRQGTRAWDSGPGSEDIRRDAMPVGSHILPGAS
jgi:pimeloyl-ACP methyl ester carboxylesterase